MKLRNLLISPIALLGLGATSVTYSPITCGCITEGDSFLQRFNIARPSLGDPKAPETEIVRRALNHHLSHKKVNLETLRGVTSCAKISHAQYRCTYWLWSAPGRERGVEVTITANEAGFFQSATVKPSLRIGTPALPGETEDTET